VSSNSLACKLHSCDKGWVVHFPSLVVKVISYPVHGRNNSGDAGRILREKECCILILLQKGVSIWVDNIYEYIQVILQQDLQ